MGLFGGVCPYGVHAVRPGRAPGHPLVFKAQGRGLVLTRVHTEVGSV